MADANTEAANAAEYIESLPEKRVEPFTRLLTIIGDNIDPAFAEQMSYGMPGWVVPHSTYPGGYHCTPELPVPFLSLGNQKGHIGLYHMGLYADQEALAWFTDAYAKTGFKLNMGASCIRFTAMGKIPYDLVGELAARITHDHFVNVYTAADPRNS